MDLLLMMKKIASIVSHLRQVKPQVVLIGCSCGGLEALEKIFTSLPKSFPAPIIVCQHLAPDSGEYLVKYISKWTNMSVWEACSDMAIKPGNIYFAPGGYHLLIEANHQFSLDVSEKVSYCRPSIDVLLTSALAVYKSHILAILLSGANEDGCMGTEQIFDKNGLIIVQDPETAKCPELPRAIINTKKYHYILSPQEINQLLLGWSSS